MTPREEAAVLRAQGLSYQRIGDKLGVAHSLVQEWLKPEYRARARARTSARLKQKVDWPCDRCGVKRPIARSRLDSIMRGDSRNRCRVCYVDPSARRELPLVLATPQELTDYWLDNFRWPELVQMAAGLEAWLEVEDHSRPASRRWQRTIL